MAIADFITQSQWVAAVCVSMKCGERLLFSTMNNSSIIITAEMINYIHLLFVIINEKNCSHCGQKKKNHYVLTHSFGTRSETNIETERDNKHETHICKVDKLREKYAEQFVHLASSCGFSLPLLLVVYVFRRLLIRTRSFQRRTEWMELLGEAILVWQSRAFVACTNTATASSWLAFQRFRLRWGFSSAYHSNARRSPISLCIVFQFHYKQK